MKLMNASNTSSCHLHTKLSQPFNLYICITWSPFDPSQHLLPLCC